MDLSLGAARGQAKLELNNGSFLPVSANATGPLRFISIFNLAGLVQRANVNQLFDPGLTFDKATGDLSLDGERVVINKFAIRNGEGVWISVAISTLLVKLLMLNSPLPCLW